MILISYLGFFVKFERSFRAIDMQDECRHFGVWCKASTECTTGRTHDMSYIIGVKGIYHRHEL